jgi:DHA2 family multidrug resistance protein
VTSAALPAPPVAPASSAVDPYANRYVIAFSVTLAAVLELIDTSIVNVAIPHMMGNLGATLDEIAWVSTSYIIANVIVIPMSSWLAGWFGRRRYLTLSILLFVVASFMCGASTGLWELVLWRVVQGLGGGALLSTAQATLYEAFPPEEVGMGQAIFGMGVMVGPTLGPTLGGLIIDNYEWPWIFYINVPLGLIAAGLVWSYVTDSRLARKATRIDGWGIAFLAVGIGALQWMLERGERNDWFESRLIVVLALTSVASLVAFVWRQLTFEQPIVNLRVLRSRQLATGVVMAAVLGFALFGSVFVLPIFLQQVHGFTAWQTGQVIFPGAIASAVTMAVVGRNANRIDARYTVVAGSAIFLLCMWQLAHLAPDAGADDVFWPLILRGFGLGLIFVPLTNASMADLKAEDVPQGTALFNLTRQLGGSLGIALLATLLTRFQLEGRATLVTHLAQGDPVVTQRLAGLTQAMVARGGDAVAASQRALAVLQGEVLVQASVLAFSKLYLLSGIVLCAACPLLVFWKTGRNRSAAGLADMH